MTLKKQLCPHDPVIAERRLEVMPTAQRGRQSPGRAGDPLVVKTVMVYGTRGAADHGEAASAPHERNMMDHATRRARTGTGYGFGTSPVFLAGISTILGAILFLRFGYAVGNVGMAGAIVFVLIGYAVTKCAPSSSESSTERTCGTARSGACK